MERKTRIPITRLSRYYDDFDFEMELEMAREVIEDDAGFKIVLFRVDKTHSNSDIYGESNKREIRFLSPIELYVTPLLEDAENKNYGENGTLKYQEYGNFTFTILNKQMEEKGVDISYGDIVGYAINENNLKYFEVHDDGRINADNESTQFGFKSVFSKIKCVTVDPNQFNGI
jgi:hypothetical protein